MKLLRATLYPLCALTLVACSAHSEPELDPILEGKADNPAEATSRAGQFVTTTVPILDGCDMDLDVDEAELVEITVAADGKSFVLDTDGEKIDCLIDEEGEFECAFEPPPHPLLQRVEITLAGGFDGANRFEAFMSTSIDCEDDECDELAVMFDDDVELPCASSAVVVGTRAQDDDFEVVAGEYEITVSPPAPGVSTCQSDTLGELAETVTIATDDDGFTLDDGLGLFECLLGDGGALGCDRVVELPGISFTSTVAGAFMDQDKVIGGLKVDVRCEGDAADCVEAEALFGELPCTAYHTLGLEAAE